MKPLEKALRSQLERVVREAIDTAEEAASASLKQLGIGESAPFDHQSESECDLRRRLRARGRQLGDALNGGKTQSMDRLVEEVAYEHWHRMLFARFLADNNLLMYPDPTNPVPISLEECEDLAVKEGAKNGWELAARFAARMLPQIFRVDSPVFQLILPPEHQQKLERLVAELPVEVFVASDSLGWVYQFWQSKKKDEVNASEVKIGPRELPAVTQLFTEPYMVSFLLDNSLGAWWAMHRLTKNDLANAKTEEELRKKAALDGVPLIYLRFVKSGNGFWAPAAGAFHSWPEQLGELKILDPCCGSGHFLVAAFLMLVPMRMELENLSAVDAVDAVLRDNLHGLEIDQRCVELAAFAIALAAWRYPSAGDYRGLPELNIASCGLAINNRKEDWLATAGNNFSLKNTLEVLYNLFKDASVLGSLINPEIGLGKGTLVEIDWEKVAPLLTIALTGTKDYERAEVSVVAQGIAKAATLLANKYHWVITNVPYLSRAKQSDILRDFCERQHIEAKNDLATVFLDRCLNFCYQGGTSSIVLPQNWLFLTGYTKFRVKLLEDETWHLIAMLGPGAFETISGEVVKAILLTINPGNFTNTNALSLNNNEPKLIKCLDVSKFPDSAKKAKELIDGEITQIDQMKQLNNPDARVLLDSKSSGNLLALYADSLVGIQTGDYPQFVFKYWEIPTLNDVWDYYERPGEGGVDRIEVILWEKEKGRLFELVKAKLGENGIGAWIRGREAWGKNGVSVHLMNLSANLYLGKKHDQMLAVIVPKNLEHLAAIWCFCSSPEYCKEVRRIDQKLNVTNVTLVKVPYDIERWTKLAIEKYPYGLPMPNSDDPTQWIFHGHPKQSDGPLQVVVARLLGYRWPAELDNTLELSKEARTLVKASEDFLPYIDEDGIVCIPSVRGEMSAENRLETLLAAVYGNEWSSYKKSELLSKVGYAGKTMESWLREKFFTQHCKLFHDRPFIWNVWDGLSDGFSALVNYHKLDAKKLETLIYTYLGDWISRQKQDLANAVDGAEEKLAAAEALKKRLELILEGEAPYDIFVRWKTVEKQPVGWNPDLNDGVRLNIRPFMSVPDVSKKGAGVLRDRPNIKWDKDRGKDVESAPWYGLFKGERINDHHLSISEKRNSENHHEDTKTLN